MERTEAGKKKKPKNIALIRKEECSGCEVCISFCPVKDCIVKIPGETFATVNPTCGIVPEKCIGCALCAKHCPWEAIVMIPWEQAMGVAV